MLTCFLPFFSSPLAFFLSSLLQFFAIVFVLTCFLCFFIHCFHGHASKLLPFSCLLSSLFHSPLRCLALLSFFSFYMLPYFPSSLFISSLTISITSFLLFSNSFLPFSITIFVVDIIALHHCHCLFPLLPTIACLFLFFFHVPFIPPWTPNIIVFIHHRIINIVVTTCKIIVPILGLGFEIIILFCNLFHLWRLPLPGTKHYYCY